VANHDCTYAIVPMAPRRASGLGGPLALVSATAAPGRRWCHATRDLIPRGPVTGCHVIRRPNYHVAGEALIDLIVDQPVTSPHPPRSPDGGGPFHVALPSPGSASPADLPWDPSVTAGPALMLADLERNGGAGRRGRPFRRPPTLAPCGTWNRPSCRLPLLPAEPLRGPIGPAGNCWLPAQRHAALHSAPYSPWLRAGRDPASRAWPRPCPGTSCDARPDDPTVPAPRHPVAAGLLDRSGPDPGPRDVVK